MTTQQVRNICYITDCCDENAKNRLILRVSHYFPGVNISFVGVRNEFEAALNCLDAIDNKAEVVFVNVAPRAGAARKWTNGTPFGEFQFDEAHVFTTIDGYTMSLLQKIAREDITIKTYDIPKIVPHFTELTDTQKKKILETQFRSLKYLPLLARKLLDGVELPHENFDKVPYIGHRVCYVDCFGNCKTSVLGEEIGFEPGKVVKVNGREMKCYYQLRDIPDGETALAEGSSGWGGDRLIEIMKQGSSAAAEMGLKSGDELVIES